MEYNFYILDRLTPESVRRESFVSIKEFLSCMSCDYPNFDLWLEKIQTQLDTEVRSIIVCKSTSDDEILGVSILKKSSIENKICTLRVSSKYQRMHIGSRLMEISLRILEDEKPLITVSEDHIDEFSTLLRHFGFKYKNKVKSLYIKGKYEYFYNKPYEHPNILMSIKPQYADAIARGEKRIEFRKQPIANTVKKIYVYSSYPKKRIIGYFDVEEVVCDSPNILWKKYSSIGGIDNKSFFKYFNGKTSGFGILFEKYHPLTDEKDPKEFDISFRAPQSFSYIDNVKFLYWING